MTIGGQEVHALRHGMVGQPGWEIFGPGRKPKPCAAPSSKPDGAWDSAGRRADLSNELPRVRVDLFTASRGIHRRQLTYRQWLTSKSYEAMASLGGSFYSEDIRDYYLTPFDLGYGPFVKFDHEFVGREALERMAVAAPRQKVTLVWNGDDVARVPVALQRRRHHEHRFAACELRDAAA